MSGEIAENEKTPVEPTEPAGADGTADVEAQLAEKEAELEHLRGILHERNKEAAEKRVRAREAENKSASLAEQVAALTARLNAKDTEAELNHALAAHGLTPEHAPLLGNDPEKFNDLAAQLKNIMGGKPESAEPQPLGIERLKGGLEPADNSKDFDPSAIIAKHRKRR